MSVSRVREIGELVGDQQQDLARVFINAFEDGGSKFPIDFDSTWRFLNYSTKGSALRKLKSDQFLGGGGLHCTAREGFQGSSYQPSRVR